MGDSPTLIFHLTHVALDAGLDIKLVVKVECLSLCIRATYQINATLLFPGVIQLLQWKKNLMQLEYEVCVCVGVLKKHETK